MPRPLAVTCALALVAPGSARAACADDVMSFGELTCSSERIATMSGEAESVLHDYSCGEPYPELSQLGMEHVYTFDCRASGTVTLLVTDMTCDFDIYILDDTCAPSEGCEAGSTAAHTEDDQISFDCVAGTRHYVVIEGYGYESGDAPCGADERYRMSFDVGSGTGCPEDCDDAVDNEFDGVTDCDDPDCATDPVCTGADTDPDVGDTSDSAEPWDGGPWGDREYGAKAGLVFGGAGCRCSGGGGSAMAFALLLAAGSWNGRRRA